MFVIYFNFQSQVAENNQTMWIKKSNHVFFYIKNGARQEFNTKISFDIIISLLFIMQNYNKFMFIH